MKEEKVAQKRKHEAIDVSEMPYMNVIILIESFIANGYEFHSIYPKMEDVFRFSSLLNVVDEVDGEKYVYLE